MIHQAEKLFDLKVPLVKQYDIITTWIWLPHEGKVAFLIHFLFFDFI